MDNPAAISAKPAVRPAAKPDAALLESEPVESAAAPSRFAVLSRGVGIRVALAALAAAILAGGAVALIRPWRVAVANVSDQLLTGNGAAVDGATIMLQGRKLRLVGIDAPSAVTVCHDASWEYRCGDEARKALDRTLDRNALECRLTERTTGDATYADCETEAGDDIASLQVESGWAVADLRNSSRYLPEQVQARTHDRGLWRYDFAQPESWRGAVR